MENDDEDGHVGMCAVSISHLICHGLLKSSPTDEELGVAVQAVERATAAEEMYRALAMMVAMFADGRNIQFGTMTPLGYYAVLSEARAALKLANPLGFECEEKKC